VSKGDDIAGIRQMLSEVGARLSDVFGADQIIWVEGPTEMECFPMLLRAKGIRMPRGLTIAALRNTGDLEGRHAAAFADIYRNLSNASTLLPTPYLISLDGDRQCGTVAKRLGQAFNTPKTNTDARTASHFRMIGYGA
jgi:hypothetical protein